MPDGKAHILIVEDDLFLSKILSSKLSKEGFDVALAMDGDEALAELDKQIPDLVLLDIILPKKNGFEVLEEMRLNSKFKNIPVIILSNLGQESDIKRGQELGAVDYLVKANFSLQEVVSKARSYLAKRK